MLDGSAEEYGYVRRPSTDVDEARSKLFLIISQYGVTGGQLLEHDIVDFEAAAFYALDDILRCALRAGHHVHLGFQPHT